MVGDFLMKRKGTSLLEKQILHTIFGKIENGSLAIRYWDGEEIIYGQPKGNMKLIFKTMPTLHFANDPILAMGESYMSGALDYEGHLEDFLRLLDANPQAFVKNNILTKTVQAMSGLSSRFQAKQNIQHHYDLGNDFFSLWLDKTMSYSCAYFKHSDNTLEQAQLQKIDYILKKLNLKPGEALLDIGCGWGWLIIKAVQTYGVKAMGITLSEEQFKKSQQRIASLNLTDQITVKLLNYLDLDEKTYRFDKIVSVGMFEHVGKKNIPNYLEKISSLLAPGGLSLLHTITDTTENKPENSWIKKFIFPGGYVPSLREVIWQLPEYDFHLLHMESLRMHYAKTLDCWYHNFSDHIDIIKEKFDDQFVRMWSLYLQGCAAAFRATGLDIHQLLFSKGLNNNLPLTYEHLHN
ncbi:cyclopropane-fatty-acyl-phospholipid synthase [Pelosinus propionicus DSM 13327]|uniref:Cyclopropane-fatty-acyl-phospholipid synthase n=2 Tax=Pelosinus TaxID=365348 RepID=A0A1I4JX06_9FIRM|nr:cyclopropane-fatty-acyl-phospholipid synthase [Pelosinus propionicus DSM 13327]